MTALLIHKKIILKKLVFDDVAKFFARSGVTGETTLKFSALGIFIFLNQHNFFVTLINFLTIEDKKFKKIEFYFIISNFSESL